MVLKEIPSQSDVEVIAGVRSESAGLPLLVHIKHWRCVIFWERHHLCS